MTAGPLRGAVVSAPTRKQAEELYETRALLEGLAGRLFARRASEVDRRRLWECFEEIERAVDDSSDTWEMLAAKNRFYEVLLQGPTIPPCDRC
jgi:DNA-binding GntR family transcriptional regulator